MNYQCLTFEGAPVILMDLSMIDTRFSCVFGGFSRTFRAAKLARHSLASGRAWLIPLLCLPLPKTSERGMEISAERPEILTTLDAFVTHTSRVDACTLTSVDLFSHEHKPFSS